MLRLLRFMPRNSGPIFWWPCAPMPRTTSPSGDSTLITSAPRSPSICVAEGPMKMVVMSMTRTPVSGPRAPGSSPPGRGELEEDIGPNL